ncbi:MAG: PAS domain S-box protein [Nitrospinae bacterium]|nr:PAS domain S-box protein [Nitrospinota bacterium]
MHRVLIVDDETAFLDLLRDILAAEGYDVISAENGKEAIEKLKAHSPIAVTLADHKMPVMKGAEYLKIAREISPNTTRIMMTAFRDSEMMQEAINKGEVFRFLTKPIDVEEVVNVTRLGVERYEAIAQRAEKEVEKDDMIRKLYRGVQQSPASVVIADREGNIEYVNPKFTKLTGYALEEVKGRNPQILKSDDRSPEEYRNLWETIRSGQDWQGEFHNRKKNGEPYWEYATISPIKNAQGEITHFIAVEEDITGLKKTEEELRRAKEAAEAATRAKSVFLAQMSHELRTPMNAILGYSELLEEEAAEKGVEDFIPDLQKIQSAGKHLLGLINNILDLSKIESGKMDIHSETVELEELVREAASVVKPLAEKNSNRLEIHASQDLGTIETDSTKLLQILLNLIGNACKFTEKGTVTLRVDRDIQDGRDWFVFKVTDTGIGMTPEQMSKVFQEFVQADPSTHRRFGGTGLGLAISRLYCRLMGGDIEAESESGKGSTFTARLPKNIKKPSSHV